MLVRAAFLLLVWLSTVPAKWLTGDGIVIKKDLVYSVTGENRTVTFELLYSQLGQWREICNDLSMTLGVDKDIVVDIVGSLLEDLKIPLTGAPNRRISSAEAVSILAQSAAGLSKRAESVPDLFYLDKKHPFSWDGPNQSSWQQRLYPAMYAKPSWLPPYLRKPAPSSTISSASPLAQIVLYQTIGANTGGTTAMLLLHRTLLELGYDSLLCNGTNRYETQCTQPSDHQVVITGEWCHEVLEEYVLHPHPAAAAAGSPPEVHDPDNLDRTAEAGGANEEGARFARTKGGKGGAGGYEGFYGRGVQYYLGFHHAQDSCRGRAALTDCHYLSKSLGARHLAGHYLGCAMSDSVREAVRGLFEVIEGDAAVRGRVDDVGASGGIAETPSPGSVHIAKEDLILVDPDFFSDYSPYPSLPDLRLPAGYTFVYAKGIPAAQMPVLLQRAKIVLDLGMPGPERLSTECILFGCIPVISSRWTGASRVDYPGVRRVDHHNASDIEAALAHIAAHYETQLRAAGNAVFFQYALSMWGKIHGTADVVLGSAYLHFILHARTLLEEYMVVFQLLSLLYLFPLCSVDIYVTDVLWFTRHHYAFMDLLQQAGYVRLDPLHPDQYTEWRKDPLQTYSFVRLKYLHVLDAFLGGLIGGEESAGRTPEVEISRAGSALPAGEARKVMQDASLLSPTWRAVVIVLPVGVTFADAPALLGRISLVPVDGHSALCHDSEGMPRGNSSVCVTTAALIVAPRCALNNVAAHLHNTLSAAEKKPAPQLPFSRGLVPVCVLLAPVETSSAGATLNPTPALVTGVVHTAAWQNMRVLADALEFKCS